MIQAVCWFNQPQVFRLNRMASRGTLLIVFYTLAVLRRSSAQDGVPLTMVPTEHIQFTKGTLLEDLPGASKLEGPPAVASDPALDISLVAALIEGPVNTPNRNFSFYGYAYRDNTDATTNLFGPPLYFTAGKTHHLVLKNELTLPYDETEESDNDLDYYNYYRLPTHTNLHLHGMWIYGGVPDLNNANVPYVGIGDNVYLDIPPKPTPDSAPASNNFTYVVEAAHMPGTHWYHPHYHGSTSVQVQSGSGPIIVDSSVKYLTLERGCGPLEYLLQHVKTRMLYIQAFMFQDSIIAGSSENIFDVPGYDQVSDADTPPYVAYPNNPICCNTSRTGYGFNATQMDVAMVNGGLQPIIKMAPNVPQRWRIFNANWKGYHDLVVVYANQTVAPCKFHLLSKDGIYLMEIPRLVDDIILAVANRAEALIECDGSPGDTYYLATGVIPHFGNGYDYMDDPDRFYQSNVAEIQLVAPSLMGIAEAELEKLSMKLVGNKACVPMRSSYVADLRKYTLQGNLTLDDATYNTTRKVINMTEYDPYGCEINGRNFTYPTQTPLTLPLGQVLELHYFNQANHPSHLHENPQQIFLLNTSNLLTGVTLPSYYQEGDWGDTFKLPLLKDFPENILTTRTQPGPFSGYSVLHCHFLHHEDVGCMTVVQWPCPDNNHPGGNAVINYPCSSFQFPVTGDFGVETFMGMDGNPRNSNGQISHNPWTQGQPGFIRGRGRVRTSHHRHPDVAIVKG